MSLICFFTILQIYVFYTCYTLFFRCLSTALLTLHRTIKQGGNPRRVDGDRKQGKENIFGAMSCRSKMWQSHDQRHSIIPEPHCSFNPCERTMFYCGEGGNNVGVANTARKPVSSCWKCSLLNVAWHFWGRQRRQQYKASLYVWRLEAELVGLETQMCHKSLSTCNHWIVLLFFSLGMLGKLACWVWPDCDIPHQAHRNGTRYAGFTVSLNQDVLMLRGCTKDWTKYDLRHKI